MVDSTIIYIAEQYGFGDEEDVLKKELRTLQYDYMVEKTKNMDNSLEEVKALQQEVKKLTEDKVYLLEKQIERLEIENQQYKLHCTGAALPTPNQPFSLERVQRFLFQKEYIKCIFDNGLSEVYPLTEQALLGHLSQQFRDISFAFFPSSLTVTHLTKGAYQTKNFDLSRFIPMADLQELNQQSGIEKRTIY